jgi:hypothetical protein
MQNEAELAKKKIELKEINDRIEAQKGAVIHIGNGN